MINVCTQAGLNNKEQRLLIPARAPETDDLVFGDGLRESGDGGESGGAGSRVLDLVFRASTRPASMI